MFRLALSSHIYFLLLETRDTLVFLRSENACFGAQVSSKYGTVTWYSERVILQFMYVGSFAGVTYLRYTVLISSNKSETAVHCCDPALSVLVMLVFRSVFHVVSALQSFAFTHFILPAKISCRSYVGSVNRIRSLFINNEKTSRGFYY